MKKFILFICSFFLCINSIFAFSFDTNSKEILMINLNDDSILYEKNIDERTQIASLTKIMTAIVVLDNVEDLSQKVTIIDEDYKGLIEANAMTTYLSRNKEYTYYDLLYGLLLVSGADCANALARLVGNGLDGFYEMMNEKAKELGLNNTHFSNAIGLDDDNNYSTARDVSIMFKYALKNEDFKKIISSSNYSTYDNVNFVSTMIKYLNRYNIDIPNLIGGKTGTEDRALSCLASIASYNDVDYMLIVLNAESPGQLTDTKNIYNYYMENYSYRTLIKKGDTLVSLKTLYGKTDKTNIKALNDYSYYLENNQDIDNVKLKYSGVKLLKTNMKKHEKLGKIDVYLNDEKIDSFNVYLNEKVKFSLFSFIKVNIIYFIGLFVVILFILFRKFKKAH